jgi:hypothetical protein
MAVLHHLHYRELLKDIVILIQTSPSTVTFYKVKSHSGIIGNEGADHLAHKAAVNQTSDVSLPPATDPFYDLFWLNVPNKVGSHAEELRVLTNLQDKLKQRMHAHHYLGEANTETLLYKLWQKLHDTPQRAAQPDSHTRQATAKPLAHAQFSNKFWSMLTVNLRNRNNSLSTGRIRYTQTNTPKGLAIRQVLPPALCVEDQTVLHTYFLGATTIL